MGCRTQKQRQSQLDWMDWGYTPTSTFDWRIIILKVATKDVYAMVGSLVTITWLRTSGLAKAWP